MVMDHNSKRCHTNAYSQRVHVKNAKMKKYLYVGLKMMKEDGIKVQKSIVKKGFNGLFKKNKWEQKITKENA